MLVDGSQPASTVTVASGTFVGSGRSGPHVFRHSRGRSGNPDGPGNVTLDKLELRLQRQRREPW